MSLSVLFELGITRNFALSVFLGSIVHTGKAAPPARR
jgi:hypothetical protein